MVRGGDQGVDVTFEHGAPRRFGLVIGADGLHSTVRRLTFGDESQFRRYIGGYLSVFTVPDHLGMQGRMLIYNRPGKVAAMYPVHQTGQARAGFLFRRAEEFDYDHRDLEQQKRLLRESYAGEQWQVPRLPAELDSTPDFYFDSISQILMGHLVKGAGQSGRRRRLLPRSGGRWRHHGRGRRWVCPHVTAGSG